MILALDPATRLGFAVGEPGAIPRSGTIRLKQPDEPFETAATNMAAWLRDTLTIEPVDLVVVEHFLSPKYSSSQNAAIMGVGLYAIAASIAGLYGIRFASATPAEIRAFVCGRASAASRRRHGAAPRTQREIASARAATKQMVLDRCKLLKLLPEDCMDDNRADACALWEFSCARFARAERKELFLFGEEKRCRP